MRFVRLLVLSFVFLFLLVTIISLFIPSRVRISRAMNVKAAPAAISGPIIDMYRWPEWNPFFAGISPGATRYLDTANGQLQAMEVNGTHISWQQKNQDEYIAAMQREGRKPVFNVWKMIHHEGSDSTTVQWYMEFNLKWYPWEKFSSLLFDRSYGSRMEEGLGNLRKIIVSDRTSQ